MPEDLNRDPLLGKLARMRPTNTGIDRDEMLFATGRASAPRAGAWKRPGALLALTQTVTLTLRLTPNDYPKPASRAYLLPEFSESIQGNRVQMFLRCFMEQDSFFGRAESERRQKWNEMPLKDLPLKEGPVEDGPGQLVHVKNYG